MRIALISLTLFLAACQGRSSAAQGLPPPPPHPNGQVLWHIVHGQCVPDEEKGGNPDPCAAVSLTGGEAQGYAVLKDKHGAEQYLVMPTADITGIEDARVLAPGAPNYFADAWASKPFVDRLIGRTTPRQDMAVSVNSLYGRSQDLLHLHVDCLTPESLAALTADAPKITGRWSAAPLVLNGHPYYAMRLMGDSPPANPFDLLAQGIPGAREDMGAWTLILAGAQFDGRPGFILLANRADPLRGDFASGEELQDHECRIARAG
jgi:CDP-diacylglycerol pyrophosphatase